MKSCLSTDCCNLPTFFSRSKWSLMGPGSVLHWGHCHVSADVSWQLTRSKTLFLDTTLQSKMSQRTLRSSVSHLPATLVVSRLSENGWVLLRLVLQTAPSTATAQLLSFCLGLPPKSSIVAAASMTVTAGQSWNSTLWKQLMNNSPCQCQCLYWIVTLLDLTCVILGHIKKYFLSISSW